MKKVIFTSITLLFILSFTFSYAQKDTIWFDANWNETTKNKANFYRCHCNKVDNGYWFIDYYISGAKQMEGLSLDKDIEIYHGIVKWYHENGNIFQIVNYKNGILFGTLQVFYENGKLKNKSTYRNGKIEGKWSEYFENSKLKETGMYLKGQKDGLWKTYYYNGKLKSEGKYVFNRKIDIWKTNYYDGMIESD